MTTLPYPQLDDYSGSTATTGAIAIGKPARGVLNPSFTYVGDSDWFRVSLTAGETYVFAMTNISLGTPAAVELLLRDASGKELILRSGVAMQAPAFEFTATSSGTYYLDARTLNAYGGSSANQYEVSVSLKPAGDDYLATSATTGVLVPGVQKSAVLENAGDADWFKFSAQVGKTYALAPAAANAGVLAMTVTDASGKVLAANGQAFTATAAGDYFVNVTGYKAGAYAFTLSEATDAIGATAATAVALAKGAEVSAAMDYIGDADWFRLSLEANTFYTFELERGKADVDPLKLEFLKADGTVLPYTISTDANGKAVAVIKVDSAGDYFASVSFSQYTSGAVAKPYTLEFSAVAVVDDHGATAATATPVAIGTATAGEITGVEDADVFKVAFKAGVTYTLDLAGLPALSVRTELLDAHGQPMRYESTGTYSFTPYKDGDYTFHIHPMSPYADAKTTRLPYTFTASHTVDDFAANAAGAGKLAVGSSIAGTLSDGGGDRDWIGVDMVAGTTYWLSLANETNTYNTIGGGRLYDAAGSLVRDVAGAGGMFVPTLSFKPTVSGTYYYEVFSPMNSNGAYRVTAAVGTPDDFGDTFLTASPLADGVAVRGKLEVSSDIDSFKVSHAPGKLFVIALEGGQYTSGQSYDFKVFNSIGQDAYPQSVSYAGKTKYALYDGLQDVGVVQVLANSYYGSGASAYTIKTYSVDDDYAATILTTGKVAVNGSATGTIDAPGDRDYFKVTLEAGKSYVIDLHGAASGAGSFDASSMNVLSVMDPLGVFVNYNGGQTNGDARIEYVAKMSGDFYIGVGNVHASPSAGTYKVSVNSLSGDVVAPALAAAPATAVPITGKLAIGFSEQVKVDGSAFTIKDSSGQHVLASTLLNVSTLHNTVTIDPVNFLQPGRSYTLEIGAGGVRDLAGNLYTGQQSFSFTTPAAAAKASAGNDLLSISASGNYLDAGAGLDTVILPGGRNAYQVIPLGDGRLQVQPVNGAASNVLVNVERLFFDDQAIALDGAGSGGQAFRLYQAAFNRAPDSIGVGYWTTQIDQGTSLKAVAQSFIASAEFVGLYGSMTSNAEFVDLLYQNVLHRPGDAEGVAYWNKMLADGQSRADTLLSFSESVENIAASVSVIASGFAFTPY